MLYWIWFMCVGSIIRVGAQLLTRCGGEKLQVIHAKVRIT